MPKLITIAGVDRYSEQVIVAGCNHVGRGAHCHIIVKDMTSSRSHCIINYNSETETMLITDCASKHGVYVNSIRVTDATELKQSDHIRIGRTVFFVSLCDVNLTTPPQITQSQPITVLDLKSMEGSTTTVKC